MKVTLTRVTTNPILAVEEAASNCYDSEPTTNGRIMKACYKSGHHSVLEFADFTFHIEGISRACSHQLVRHRHASYAQRSQRYVNEDGFKYVMPSSIAKDGSLVIDYQDTMNMLDSAYNYLIDNGIPEEDARMILPNACETVIEVKMNGRELIHFANERLCTRAQWEIRELVRQMKKCLEEYNDECKTFSEFLVPKCQAHKPYVFCTEHGCCGMSPKLKDVYTAYLSAKEGDSND